LGELNLREVLAEENTRHIIPVVKLTNVHLMLFFTKILHDLLASFSNVSAECVYSRKSIPLFMSNFYASLKPNK
jgi:hypothetical protein